MNRRRKKADLGTSKKLKGWIGISRMDLESLSADGVGNIVRDYHCGGTRETLIHSMTGLGRNPIKEEDLKNYVAVRVDMILTPRGIVK